MRRTITAASPARSRARTLLVVGLAIAALGTLLEYLTGVPGFPTVPPGPIILAVMAVVVAVLRWRWTPVLGVLVALFIAAGAVASGVTLQLLAAPAVLGQFAAAAVQVVGLVLAVVAGVAAVAQAAGAHAADGAGGADEHVRA